MFEFPDKRPSWTYSPQHSRFFSRLVQYPKVESDSLKMLKLAYCNESQEPNSSNNDTGDSNENIEEPGKVTRPSDLVREATFIRDVVNDESTNDVERPPDTVRTSNPRVSNSSEISDSEMELEEGECPPTPPPDDPTDSKNCKVIQKGKKL